MPESHSTYQHCDAPPANPESALMGRADEDFAGGQDDFVMVSSAKLRALHAQLETEIASRQDAERALEQKTADATVAVEEAWELSRAHAWELHYQKLAVEEQRDQAEREIDRLRDEVMALELAREQGSSAIYPSATEHADPSATEAVIPLPERRNSRGPHARDGSIAEPQKSSRAPPGRVVEKILLMRCAPGGPPGHGPDASELEFFVKWKGLAHEHCEWVTHTALEGDPSAKQRVRRFLQVYELPGSRGVELVPDEPVAHELPEAHGSRGASLPSSGGLKRLSLTRLRGLSNTASRSNAA